MTGSRCISPLPPLLRLETSQSGVNSFNLSIPLELQTQDPSPLGATRLYV